MILSITHNIFKNVHITLSVTSNNGNNNNNNNIRNHINNNDNEETTTISRLLDYNNLTNKKKIGQTNKLNFTHTESQYLACFIQHQ